MCADTILTIKLRFSYICNYYNYNMDASKGYPKLNKQLKELNTMIFIFILSQQMKFSLNFLKFYSPHESPQHHS